MIGAFGVKTTFIITYTKTFRPNLGLRLFLKKASEITGYLTGHSSARATPAKFNE